MPPPPHTPRPPTLVKFSPKRGKNVTSISSISYYSNVRLISKIELEHNFQSIKLYIHASANKTTKKTSNFCQTYLETCSKGPMFQKIKFYDLWLLPKRDSLLSLLIKFCRKTEFYLENFLIYQFNSIIYYSKVFSTIKK